MKDKQNIVWRQPTRNHHVGELDGIPVVAVVRPQKHRPNGTPYDWQIEVFGSRSIYANVFASLYDPRDLESTKNMAAARASFAIERLYKAAFL